MGEAGVAVAVAGSSADEQDEDEDGRAVATSGRLMTLLI
jgi:hypothetical protein